QSHVLGDPAVAVPQPGQPHPVIDPEGCLLVGRGDRVVAQPLLEGVPRVLAVRVAEEAVVALAGGLGPRLRPATRPAPPPRAPGRRCASGLMASLLRCCPQSLRPDLTCLTAKSATALTNPATSFRRRVRRRNHSQARATTSATASSRLPGQRRWRKWISAWVWILGRTWRNRACSRWMGAGSWQRAPVGSAMGWPPGGDHP